MTDAHAAASSASNGRKGADRRPTARAIGVAAVLALAIGLLALGLASVLDAPVGGGARDVAQPIVAGPIVGPGEELTGGPSGLPPLALALERPLPGDIASLPPEAQVQRLQALASSQPQPRRFVELGVALQSIRRLDEAREAFEGARRLAPNAVAPSAGLAVTTAATGPAGLEEADAALADLERQHPDSQIASFNRGWVAIYARDDATATVALERTVAIAPQTRLGQAARGLLAALQGGQLPGSGAGTSGGDQAPPGNRP